LNSKKIYHFLEKITNNPFSNVIRARGRSVRGSRDAGTEKGTGCFLKKRKAEFTRIEPRKRTDQTNLSREMGSLFHWDQIDQRDQMDKIDPSRAIPKYNYKP